jgi:hypothetical protein
MNSLNKRSKLLKRIRTLIIILLVVFGAFIAALMFFFYINMGPKNTSTYRGPRKVSIENKNGKYSFYKNGKPFFVKGGSGIEHIKELSETGGNTIMVWDTAQLKNVFEEAARFNVSVIIGLDIPPVDTGFYDNIKNVADLYTACLSIVNRYKDNPCLLAWCLGNEIALPSSFTRSTFYRVYNQILDRIHNIDPNHPVCTSIVNVLKRDVLTLKWRIPALDFYSINTYNSLKILEQILERDKLFWDGPYIIGEWAPQGGWEAPSTVWKVPIEYSSTTKAQLFYEFYTKYMPFKDPRFMGSVVFFWGQRQEYTQSWFSIFDKDGNANEIKEALNDCWRDTTTPHVSPKIKSVVIDNLNDKNNIIITSGSKHSAAVIVQAANPFDSLRYKWEMYREDWNYPKGPPVVSRLFADSTLPVTDFRAPQKEGPYRVFITVYNSKGYFATANIPIYVIR